MSYYVYKKEDDFGVVSDKPQSLPIIQIAKTFEQAEITLKNYIVKGKENIVQRKKYHYGIVIGKVSDTILKCVECVEYNLDFSYGKYNLNLLLNKNNIGELPYIEVLSDETNVIVLEEETEGFSNYNTGIWWHHNRKHGSPIKTQESKLI